MSTIEGGGYIVRNGLILHLDAANTKSYVSGNTTWNDMSTKQINGTLTNGPTFSQSNNGGIVLDGVNNYISIGNNSNYYFNGLNPFTLSIWFKPNEIKFSGLISRFNSGVVGNYFLSLESDGSINFHREKSPNYNLFSTQKLTTGNTYNIVAVYDGVNTNIYINNVLDGSISSGNITANQSNIQLFIGAFQTSGSATNILNGTIYCTKIYNRGLSSVEVSQNYNTLKGRFGL